MTLAGRSVVRVLTWTAGALLLALTALALWVGPTLYRVLHGVRVYETVPPQLPDHLSSPAILLFSKTNGYRHEDAIPAARAMFRAMARRQRLALVETDNAAIFNPAQLGRFRVVIWNNVSGDVLTLPQRAAFRTWLEHGGGFVGIHATAGDPSYRWRWYVDTLIGAQFVGHPMYPQIQRATIHVADPRHAVTAGLAATWTRSDEWYSFDRPVRRQDYHVLATLDEATYSPVGLLRGDLRMGPNHPVAWTHCVRRGRVFYSALGHTAASYAEPLYRMMLANAVRWAAASGGCDPAQAVPRPSGRGAVR